MHSLLYTQAFLHLDTFTQSRFHTQTVLRASTFTHTDPCVHKQFYTQALVHTGNFIHRTRYTETLLHTRAFTNKHFYTQTLLHTDSFTHRPLYTQTVLHTAAFTHKGFYTQTLLHNRNRNFTDSFGPSMRTIPQKACRRTTGIAILLRFRAIDAHAPLESLPPDNRNRNFTTVSGDWCARSYGKVAAGQQESQFY